MCTLSWYFLAEGEEKRGPGHRGAAGARVTWFWMLYIFFKSVFLFEKVECLSIEGQKERNTFTMEVIQ